MTVLFDNVVLNVTVTERSISVYKVAGECSEYGTDKMN